MYGLILPTHSLLAISNVYLVVSYLFGCHLVLYVFDLLYQCTDISPHLGLSRHCLFSAPKYLVMYCIRLHFIFVAILSACVSCMSQHLLLRGTVQMPTRVRCAGTCISVIYSGSCLEQSIFWRWYFGAPYC